ncbi:MAG: hypothetical protein M5U12_00310 [Verrucomicrobia bacterium]|nr:hypothetical protein [Verrucomicrobiota bacterium]
MPDEFRVVVVSDIHYASAGEKARGGYEYQALRSWTQRVAVGLFRRWIWLKDPLAHNHQLERFLAAAGPADLAVANGDYSCDSAFVGLSDDAAFASARHVLERLRERFPGRLVAGFGDHELGKKSLFGGAGGLRLRSRERSIQELGLEDFWRRELGPWVLFGVTSSLVALPVFRPETQPEEQPEWERLRELHLKEVRDAFRSLRPGQRVVLFCHDPTALPFLWGRAGGPGSPAATRPHRDRPPAHAVDPALEPVAGGDAGDPLAGQRRPPNEPGAQRRAMLAGVRHDLMPIVERL